MRGSLYEICIIKQNYLTPDHDWLCETLCIASRKSSSFFVYITTEDDGQLLKNRLVLEMQK